MTLLSRLTAELGLTPADLTKGNSHLGRLLRAEGVEATEEFERVDGLLRRPENPADDPDAVRLAELLTRKYGKTGTMPLRPWQARALGDAHDYGGCLAVGPVGIGKTLVSYLAGVVCGAKRPLLLIPSKLVEKTKRDFAALSKLWDAHSPAIRTYEELGVVSGQGTLDRVLSDLIIADECHKLRNPVGVTRRIEDYCLRLESHGASPRLLFMSGTILDRGLMTFQHLLKWCTGLTNCPLPTNESECALWGRAVDVKTRELRVAPGALGDSTESARVWVTSRIRSAPGVAWSPAPEVKANLRIRVWSPELPDQVKQALVQAERGRAPDGSEFETEDDQGRVLRTLPLGFWRRWVEAPHPSWVMARRRYWAFVRDTLGQRLPGLDTELQVRTERASWEPVRQWQHAQDFYEEPPRETVWIDETCPYDHSECRDWSLTSPTLIWTWYQAPGEQFYERGIPYFGEQGLDAMGNFIEDHPGDGHACLSVAANNEGRNLQHKWHRNLILTQTSSAGAYEQLIGRTYRPGQSEDTVYVTIYAPTARARATFFSAVEEAKKHGSMLLARADYE